MHHSELAARRKSLGISQEDLARRLGVALNTVYRWERGTLRIQHSEMLRFSLDGIEDDLREEWEALPNEEKHRRNGEKIAQLNKEAAEHEAKATPEEKAAYERWFGNHRPQEKQDE